MFFIKSCWDAEERERSIIMKPNKKVSGKPAKTQVQPHKAARPMEVVKDEDGNLWLCDKGVAPREGKKDNRCWRCGDLAFTASD